jgi:hypothetical protein
LFFSFSNDLSLAAECTPYATGQYSSSLSLDPSGNPHVAWEQVLSTPSPDCNQNDIYYTNSADGGMSFSPATADIDRLPTVTQARVSLEVDGNGNPAVAWVDTRNDGKSVYFARSFDGGDTFTPGIRIDSSSQRQDRPCLVFDSNNNPVIAWVEVYYVAPYQNPVGYVYVTRSVDGGATFLPSVCVCANSKPYQGWPALVMDSNNNPMVALHYYGNWNNSWNLFFVRSNDQGESFLRPVCIEESAYDQYMHGNDGLVVDSQDDPCIVFNDNRSGRWNIRFSRSVNGGRSFLPSIPIDPYPTRQIIPSLGIDSNDNLYVVWGDKRSGYSNIHFTMSEDGGVTFRTSIPVDEVPAFQNRACLDVDFGLGIPHVTWTDNRQGRGYVYHTESLDHGASFMPSMPVYQFPVD